MASSICESYDYLRELRCDSFIDKCDDWVLVPFHEQVVDSKIARGSNFYIARLVELQREHTGTRENSVLITRVLTFVVPLKVSIPCLRVLHVMWSAMCIQDPWLCYDGHTHGRWLAH